MVTIVTQMDSSNCKVIQKGNERKYLQYFKLKPSRYENVTQLVTAKIFFTYLCLRTRAIRFAVKIF